MPNPTVVADLEEQIGPLDDQRTTMATSLLVDAWEELLARIPDLEQRMADGRVREGTVRRVVRAMVLRVLRNPEAIRQWTIDDAAFTRDQLVSAGLLYASPDELSLLSGTPLGPLPPISFSGSYGGRW